VLTTLHSGSAPGSIDRLLELGLSRRSIAAGLSAALGQRLVRTLCGDCKRQACTAAAAARRIGISDSTPVHEAVGCERCSGTGYRGRTGIFELLRVTPELRAAIGEGAPASRLSELAANAGYSPMLAGGRRLVLDGYTSACEVDRVTSDGL
jgi:type II secretory ATPase GspE/PulE/Tfp pilus assembly ATPase PilB-like protein